MSIKQRLIRRAEVLPSDYEERKKLYMDIANELIDDVKDALSESKIVCVDCNLGWEMGPTYESDWQTPASFVKSFRENYGEGYGELDQESFEKMFANRQTIDAQFVKDLNKVADEYGFDAGWYIEWVCAETFDEFKQRVYNLADEYAKDPDEHPDPAFY